MSEKYTAALLTRIEELLTIFIGAPIWYYLLYRILEAVNASELMWFLYWVYVPVALLCGVLSKVAEND